MHPSALEFGKKFFDTYCKGFSGLVVDIGSQNVNGSLKDVCPAEAEYIGVDFCPGNGVDIILTDPYKLPFDDESVDVIVCSSVFEHSQFFWVIFLEIMRVLKPTGLLYLNVPSNGYIHRYPVDCWRFYPDSGLALVAWAERNSLTPALLESFVGERNYQSNEPDDAAWNDFVAVFIKDCKFQDQYKNRVLQSIENYANAYCDDGAIDTKPNFLTNDLLIISKKNEQITSLNQSLTEHNGQIANLTQSVLKRDGQITNLNKLVAERDGQIASINQLVSERDGQIASVNQSVDERDAKIAHLNQSVAERDYLINAIYKSTSWKATRLMRIAGYQVKRVQSATRLIAPAIKKGGGFKKTINKAYQLYKRDGFTGIKSGFRFVAKSGQVIPAAGSAEFDRNDYAEWIRRYDTLTNEMRASIKHSIGGLVTKPLISVLMPTYNPKAEWLVAAIESVRNQIYPNWELCIADDASTNPAVREILEDYVKKDSRIKVVFREKNGHISAASNSALEVCTGDWVALLDHDDLLSEHALYWVADAINQHSDIQLIYSDEDKTDDSGRRFDPYFKCDWNLDLFYSHNLITHLGVYKAELVRLVSGFKVGLEGSQDYDLALRCIEHINPAQIHHIPKVLYHWRVHAESTASASDAKPYALLAGQKALNQHLQRKGIDAKAELVDHGFRVHYALPSNQPRVSLIIPTRNGLNLIRTCVESILKKTTYTNYEILIIDNGSDDPEVLSFFEQAKTDARVKVVVDNRPFNYSALNNAAVKLAQGTFIGLLNNDLEVISPDWLSEMVSIALQPNVGAVGARLWYPNNTLQHGGVIVGLGGVAGHAHKGFARVQHGYFLRAKLIQSLSAVTAACLIIKKSTFLEVDGLDETNLKIAFNDVDFCLRVREAGYRNVWTPFAELYHHESATRGYEDTPEKQKRFSEEVLYMQKTWGNLLAIDPAYSPNLTLDYEDFSYAWPPRIQTVPITISSRVDKVFYLLDKNGKGLEIGPSHNPIAPKKRGFDVHILDHASASDLKEKYQGHGINLDNIEEVDFVWKGEPLHELIGDTNCYKWIIASHVVEHVPDLISYFQQFEALLKKDGLLSLVVPDKRYCFDYFTPVSTTGDLLDAHINKRVKPSSGQIFDHFSNASKKQGNIAWGDDGAGAAADELVHTFLDAKSHWHRSATTAEYIDVHCWRFTPASFNLLISDLRGLGLINMEVKAEFGTTGCEFYVTLGKVNVTEIDVNRLSALQTIRKECR